MRRHFLLLALFASAAVAAQQPAAPTTPQPTTFAEAPKSDTSYIDAMGTVHVTRVVPLPATVSPQAQLFLSRQIPDQAPPQSLEERRRTTDESTARTGAVWSRLCPNTMVEDKIVGVPVRIFTPEGLPEGNRDKVLINLHGGGFNSDSGSYAESIPIASFTKMKVVSVMYRLAPEHPFPAGVDDAIAVYKELLKTYKPQHIAIYGTSAGAVITAEVAAKLKQLRMPMPAALGIFSALADFARAGDTASLFTSRGFAGPLEPPGTEPHDPYYVGGINPTDPVLSPIYGDLHGMPPALFVSSTRDMLLSGTSNLHRAFLRAGTDAQLVVFDGLPHAFWYDPMLPESQEASHLMADFFVKELEK
jgi:acetyl esterase/lipase